MESIGVYSPTSKFELNPNSLTSLGFSNKEVDLMLKAFSYNGNVTISKLQSIGLTFEQSKRIKYAYDLCTGKKVLESDEDLCKHLKKLFGSHNKMSIHNLAISNIDKINRYAIVGNIKDNVFKKLNSKNYNPKERLYPVIKVSQNRVHIKVNKLRKPVIPYGYNKSKDGKLKIDGVLEILGVDKNGNADVAINDEYCKLCNSYAILASLKRPENHLGLEEIICIEGTKVYVYAVNIGTRERISYTGGNARIYDYGVNSSDIMKKLRTEAEKVYKCVCGVKCNEIGANTEFKMYTNENKQETELEI